jgi:predicted nucleotidyltransferase
MSARRVLPPQRERPFNWRRAIANSLHLLWNTGLMSKRDSAAVLIGSYARGTAMDRSDVDILVLVPHKPRRQRIEAPVRVHLQLLGLKEFRERARNGDDYAISALRFGRALYDPGRIWHSLREEFRGAPLPNWRDKAKYGRRRLDFADQLLASGDSDAAAEEYLLAATQIGRALILLKGTQPLSRPELGSQLRAAGEAALAGIIEELLVNSSSIEQLHAFGAKLREILIATS